MFAPDAHSEDSLSECIPASLVSSNWQTSVTLFGTITAVLTLAAGIVLASELGWVGALAASSVVGFVVSTVAAVFTLIPHYLLTTQLPTVELRADRLIVNYGNRTKTARLIECHFHLGRACDMLLEGGVRLHSRVPVILIDLPPLTDFGGLKLRTKPSNVVAVGYSDDMRQKWEHALTASLNQRDSST